jgi:hypothetical protein
MDVTSVPPPIIVNNTLPQDIAAKAVPNAQAMVPLVQNAVDPAPKTEKFNAARRDKNNSRNARDDKETPDEENDKSDDHSVNIRI